METKDKKKAFDQASKEVKEEEVKKLKEVIKHTLEKLAKKEKAKKELEEECKILRNDIKDFREGRLDRIEERQKNNPKAKEVSVCKVEAIPPNKDVHHEIHHYYHWNQPYYITPQFEPFLPKFYSGTTTYTDSICAISFSCTNSTSKDFTSGTYQLEDGNVKMI